MATIVMTSRSTWRVEGSADEVMDACEEAYRHNSKTVDLKHEGKQTKLFLALAHIEAIN